MAKIIRPTLCCCVHAHRTEAVLASSVRLWTAAERDHGRGIPGPGRSRHLRSSGADVGSIMSRRLGAIVVTAAAVMAGACSSSDSAGGGDDPVAAAQVKLERAQAGLEEAIGVLDEASSQFCDDASQYIQAVDRYGGLLTDEEATVGAVTDAGADLESPRDAVGASAEEVGAAREDLASARHEVAEAEAAVAAAETGTSAEETSTTTVTTLVPDEAVASIEKAEEDLADAFADIEASTPLSEASQQVNAAAVAVQVAWMQLFAGAGCLGEEHEDAVTAVEGYTRTLQSALTAAGYFEGEVDGVYGPATVAAVEGLQRAAGLPVTGFVDRATAEALDAAVDAAGGDAAAAELAQTAALQAVLTVTGHWTGPVDGVWSDALTAALEAFQSDLGVEPTGAVDPATVAAAQQALDDIQNSPTTTGGQDDTTTSTSGGDDEGTTTSSSGIGRE